MARQCTQPKRPRNATWYKDKAMLAEAQEARQILDEEQLAFLADQGTKDIDTYDSDYDDISNAKAVLRANISNYGSDVISEVPHSETYFNDMENQSVHAMQDFKQSPVVDFIDNEIHSDSNIISYSQYLQETQLTTLQELLLYKHNKFNDLTELLVYIQDTCPNAIKLSGKKVAVTPKNDVKKVRFAEPLTSSSNIKLVESSTTSDSNTPVLSPIGLKCSTSNYRSKPTGNKKNDRISRTPSRNMKNKVEAQPMKVNKKNRIVEPIRDVDVKHFNC
ncbi:hypothetical protein Tco_1091912 [Tanacetum coccineum]|uniref:Uncharacterized protein n=1 Tax=Tanacetum coccineum TaxID=301880 RepID=A0ABQ5I9L9_9ASTR